MKLFAFAALILSLSSMQCFAAISAEEAEAIGVEAYISGYPLVTMEMTRRIMTNVASAEVMKAPMGQFVNMREYPTPAFKDVTTPNADTLYSSAWIDLSQGPYILHVPDEHDRYYLMPVLDAWTNVFADPGTRTTGSKAADYAFVGPNWTGALPPNVKEYRSPTNIAWVIGRTYSSGTPQDYKTVHEIQDKYSLVPLSAYGQKNYTPPAGKVDPSVYMKTPVRDQVNKMDANTFFKLLASLMKTNPPAPADGPILAKMAKIGLVPGKDFAPDANVSKALTKVPESALKKIQGHERSAGKVENGWIVTTNVGSYGTDYLQRAYVAMMGLGANLPKDALYPSTGVDSSGKKLSGANAYVIHFPKGKLPPVDGFWSLTMYDNQLFFVENPLNRYTLSPRNNLKYNSDGSLDLYIQNTNPGPTKESNWLPAPKGDFNLVLRLYWPKNTALDGSWIPPAVQKAKS